MRRGIAISTKCQGSEDVFNEIFLTAGHAIEMVRKVFQKADQEFTDTICRQLRNDFVRRPSPNVDPTISYVPMSSILELAVISFGKYERMELRKMLNCLEIVPPLDGPQFAKFVKGLVSGITTDEVAEFYRIMSLPQAGRITMKKSKFKSQYLIRSLLEKGGGLDILTLENVGRQTEELDEARKKWMDLKPAFEKAIDSDLDCEKNPIAAHAVQRLTLEMDSVAASLVCFDPVGVHIHVMGCIWALRSMLWSMNEPDPKQLSNLLSELRSLLQI
jgi:hypothetical protein